jgi:hypothetical protein
MTTLLRSCALLVIVFALAACAGATSPPAGDGDATEATPDAGDGGGDTGDGGDAGDGGGDPAASVEVTVTGGEFAGTYSGSVPDGGCSRGATGENTFGLQYSTSEAVDLSSVQLVVNDAEGASGGTDDFLTTFTFGELLSGTALEIQPPEGNGSGTVTVDDRGDTATIEIDAETSDGVAIDATVECHTVFDFGQ